MLAPPAGPVDYDRLPAGRDDAGQEAGWADDPAPWCAVVVVRYASKSSSSPGWWSGSPRSSCALYRSYCRQMSRNMRSR